MTVEQMELDFGAVSGSADYDSMDVWWGRAFNHLRKYRPRKYRMLKAEGKLDEYLDSRLESFRDSLNKMMSGGRLREHEALEILTPQYIYPMP